jgi:hypothetical protein
MQTTSSHNEKIAKMTFASVWPHYVKKVESKGRTLQELYRVIQWLTGYNEQTIEELIAQKVSIKEFFERAQLNPLAHKITGVICGYRVEDIQDPLTRKVRYLDKLIDELAKGKTMDKILRNNT